MQLQEYINIGLVVIGLLLIVLEIFLGLDTMLDLVMSGSSLLLGGIIGFIFSNTWFVGVIVSLLVLILYWLLGRRYLHNKLQPISYRTNVDRLVGLRTKVVNIIEDQGHYIVRVDGEDWSASSEHDLSHGDEVEIIEVNGSMLRVHRVN